MATKPTQTILKPRTTTPQLTPAPASPAAAAPAQPSPQAPAESRPQVSSVLTNEQVNASANRLQGQVATEIRQKRKYTKRAPGGSGVAPGIAPAAPLAAPIPLETLEGIIGPTFEGIAEWRDCPAWKLALDQKRAVAQNVQTIMKYISPDTTELTAAVTGVVLILGMHSFQAIMAEKDLAKQRMIAAHGVST